MQISHLCLALALAALVRPLPAPKASSLDEHFGRIMQSALDRSGDSLLKRNDFYREHATWEQAFVVSSEHYRLKTVGSRSAANKLVAGLEFMLGEFQSLLASDFVPAQRFEIDVLPLAEYNVRGDDAAEHSSFYGSFLGSAGRVAISYNPNSEYIGILATHSACHQFTQQAFGRSMPFWISEGLAAYFATFWNPEWSQSELERVKNSQAWIGMRSLLSGRASDYMSSGDTRLIELGMLFKYLLQFNETTGEDADSPFVNFLRASVRGQQSGSTLYSQRGMQEFEAGFRECGF